MESKSSKATTSSNTAAATNTPTTRSVNLTKSQSKLPKRLALLCLLLTTASISGIVAKQGVLFCVLTLLMVIAILGRQKTAMYMLQAYSLIQLCLICILPIILHDPDNLVVGNPSMFRLGQLEAKVPDYIIFTLLIILATLQVWVAFTPKVKSYFNSKVNFNIMN